MAPQSHVQKLIHARRALGGVKNGRLPDLMDILLESAGEHTETSLSEEELVSETIMFYLAGQETTSNALTWLMHTLSQHPDLQQVLMSVCREIRLVA
jgi:cytochrome P450